MYVYHMTLIPSLALVLHINSGLTTSSSVIELFDSSLLPNGFLKGPWVWYSQSPRMLKSTRHSVDDLAAGNTRKPLFSYSQLWMHSSIVSCHWILR